MSVFVNILLIAWLCVYVIDYSGAIDDLFSPIVRRLTGSRIGHIGKPFSCSLCSTLWVSLIYLLIAGEFTLLNVAFVALVSSLTPVIYLTICLLRDILETVIGWLYQIFGIG